MNVAVPPCGCSQPGSKASASCYCSVEDLLKIIRRRYSLAVLNAIRTRRHARYRTIARALPQASSSTLAETLQALEAARLIDRSEVASDQEGYALTPAGQKLLDRLRPLLDEVRTS